MLRSRMLRFVFCLCVANALFSVTAEAQLIDTAAGQQIAEDAPFTGLTLDDVLAESDPWIQPISMETFGALPCQSQCNTCCPAGRCACGCQKDDLWTRTTLTNGLFGAGAELAEHGVVADLSLTQFYQGVTSGGTEQTFAYGGKMDYIFNFQGQKLGLWEGLLINMHAETRFGDDVILDAVGLAPVNANMLYPSLNNETAITGFLITQALSEEWAVTMGKFNLFDLLAQLYPQTGRGITGFMNVSSFTPLSVARTLSLSTVGASVMKLKEGQVQGTLAVLDTNNSTTTSGFDGLFDNGAVIVGYWRLFTEFRHLPGSHALLGTYSSGTYVSTDPLNWAFLPEVGIVPGKQTGSWNLTYFFDQKLWVDRCNPQRNLGLLTSWGLSDGNPNPVSWAGLVSIQGQGLIARRPGDSLGASYFYTGLSGDFQRLASVLVNAGDAQGVELYYNAAVTPWFHLTTDLQFIDPSDATKDTAVVLGLRAQLLL